MSDSKAPMTFDELARLPDEDIDVGLGAALVARDAYDDLDVAALVLDLEALGAPLAGAALGGKTAREQAAAVSERFVALGFKGNAEDYYDPKNSLLPDVLERKLGIPITLSVVWCAIAKAAGVNARGVAFPGHFLVRVDAGDAPSERMPTIVDPFQDGRLVGQEEAAALLRRALGEGVSVHPSLFAPASPRAILVRLLTNLESTLAKRGEHARAFVAVDRILTLVPASGRMLRERAALALRIGAVDLARADLARVVELEPEAPDVPQIRARLEQLTSAPKSTLH